MTAQARTDERLIDEALAWHAALESDDADWDGYIVWLEADPRHRAAFDEVALTAATVDAHKDEVAQILARPDTVERPRPGIARRWWLGGAVAAALAMIITVPLIRSPESIATYSTDAGATRSVALANGIQVTLSSSSRMVVHGKDAARIELASGEAYFDVRHDPGRVLTVEAGPYRISDIGTRFAVNVSGGGFHVGVSEGTISVATPAAGNGVRVAAGQQLTDGAGGLALSPVATADVASWRDGRLSYANAPLALVAGDISRYSGKPVSVDPSLEKKHFSGTLVIGDGTRLLPDLAAIMGVRVAQDASGAHIGPAAR